MKRLAAVLAVSALPLTASAQAESYMIDPYHTYPYFELEHLGTAMIRGRFDKTAGKFTIDRGAKTAALEVVIQADSVTTGDNDRGGRPRTRDEHLKNADFFKGIGNAYSDEILWEACINPYTPKTKLNEEELRGLYRAARAVMEQSPHVMLIGEGADTFAASVGLEQVDPAFFFTERRWQGLERALRQQSLPVPARPEGAPGPIDASRVFDLALEHARA